MACTTVLSPGSVSTMSAAARAASVAPDTAMPTSARLSAGASLTPSPVMPTANPAWRRASTIRYLCSGKTWAKPSESMIILPCVSARLDGMVPSSFIAGSPSVVEMLVPIPSTRAVSRAISTLSPVTILTSTPFSMACSMVILVSKRGGSRNVSTPTNCQSSLAGSSGLGSVLATAMQRMPRMPYSVTLASTSSWMAALLEQSSRMMWVAPLVTLNLPSGPSIVASVRLTAGSNGMKSRCL